jgi:hypothetical protein
MNRHMAWLDLDVLATPGSNIEPFPAAPHSGVSWRYLLNGAGELWQQRFDPQALDVCGGCRYEQRSFPVVRGGRSTENDVRAVLFLRVHEMGREASCLPHDEQQDAGGERIKGSRVPDLALPRHTPNARHYIV